MPFVLRPYRRFPIVSPVIYENGLSEGQGIVWNLSPTGCPLSGNLPLACGDICSLTVIFPTNTRVSVLAGMFRWVRGEAVGIETLAMDGKSQATLGRYIRQRMKAV